MIKLSQLFGLILTVSISFQNSVLAASIYERLISANSYTLTEIQNEVYPSVRRITPFVNTWIVIAVLVSTSTVTSVLVLLVMSIQKIQQTQQNIQAMKQDTISHLNQSLSEAQAVVNDLQYSIQISQENVHKISSQTLLSSQTEQDQTETEMK
ncbi:hypothetical protein [Lyngbya aestuarii]|nr:hypothetical protein [Lyngbya aestuarii]